MHFNYYEFRYRPNLNYFNWYVINKMAEVRNLSLRDSKKDVEQTQLQITLKKIQADWSNSLFEITRAN